MMKTKVLIISSLLMFFAVTPVFAGGPEYTNVYGYGPNNSANATHAGNYCDVNSGTCRAEGGNWLVRYECSGRQPVCTDQATETWTSPGGVAGVKNVGCGRTAQVDVLGDNCRTNGGGRCWDTWKDYLVYYGGDCGGGGGGGGGGGAPGCDASQVNMNVNPNPARVGDNMSFVVSGSQGSTWVEDYWSGGVGCSGGFWGNKGCNANNAGNYSWTHVWYNNKSARCEKTVSYSITGSNPTPTPTPTSTPTPSPTPTPTPVPGAPNYCGGTCGSNNNCQTGYFCYNGFCRLPACPTSENCSCGVPAPTPVAKVTPKTGFDLYSTVSILLTSGWAGYLLFKKRNL